MNKEQASTLLGMASSLERIARLALSRLGDEESIYLGNAGQVCPKCLGTMIDSRGSIQADQDYAWRFVECHGCGAKWQDVYNLVGITMEQDENG